MTLEVFANQNTETQPLAPITDTQSESAPVQQQTQIPDAAEATPSQPAVTPQQMSAESLQAVQPDFTPTADAQPSATAASGTVTPDSQQEKAEDLFDREAVMK